MLGISVLNIVMMILGVLSLLIWLVIYINGKKYNSMFDVLSEDEYPLKEIYGMGYFVLEAIKYDYKSNGDRKLRNQLNVLYDEKYADYYIRVIHSQQITISLTGVVLSFAFYAFSADLTIFFMFFVISVALYFYFGTLTEKKILARSEELLHDFSEVVSKLALLTNAGMILREAWEVIAEAGDSVIYQEMQTSVEEMQNGVSEVDAIYNFGSRCILPEIKKFTSTIIQGMTKGNSELSAMLQEQSKEVWDLKKQLVRRDGEKASSKLMLPMCMMFIGILIMIIIPVFSNIGV